MAKTRKVAPTGADLLTQLKGSATRKPTAKKKDDRPIIVLEGKDAADVMDLIKLSTIIGELDPTRKERDKEVKSNLFKRFTQTWWEQKALPQNPRIVIRKSAISDDMSLLFAVKYREEGLSGKVPDVEDLPDGKTVEDVLFESLTAQVGLSQKNALHLLSDDGEIIVQQQLQLVGSLDELHNSSDELKKSAATKLMSFMRTGKGEALTAAERAAILHTVQTISLKKGFLERAHVYCTNVEQLRKLCEFVKTTLAISSVEFAVSDTPRERVNRLQQAVVEFMPLPDDE